MAGDQGLSVRLRKLLVFGAVFGAGLSALLFIVEPAQERGAPAPARTAAPTPDRAGPAAQEPALASAEFQGRLEYTQFSKEELDGRRPKLFNFLAGHVEHKGDEEYYVENLFLELFEPESQRVRATLRSPKSQMPIRFQAEQQEFGPEDIVELSSVDAEIFAGIPLVPARFEAIKLEVALAKGLFSTPEPVVFSAQGARASGMGFSLDQQVGRLRFRRKGEITFENEAGGGTTLAATGEGELLLERSEAGDLRVLVEGGAKLEAAAGAGVVVTAQRVEFLGEESGPGEFKPTVAIATGGVIFDGWDGRFESLSARFKFDEKGQLKEALLEGEPKARIPITTEEGQLVQLELSASDSVRLLPSAGFSVKGPCVVEVKEEGLRLECDGQLFGTGRPRAGAGWLSASGGVRAAFGGNEYLGEDLELRGGTTAAGEVEWRAQTGNEATLSGQLFRGASAPYRAQVGGGMEIAAGAEGFVIRRATDADIEVFGEGGFRLLAGELKEASLAAKTFHAVGGVHYADREITARASEAFAEAGGAMRLEGAEGSPVELELREGGLAEQGEVSAQRVHLKEGELSASGGVQAKLQKGEEGVELEAETFKASFPVLGGRPAAGPVTLSLGEVQRCRISREGETISWTADETTLSMTQHASTPDGERGELELISAEAVGGVLLERMVDGQVLAASGEHFEVSPGGAAKLLGAEGRSVRVSGVLPGGERFGRVIARELHLAPNKMIAKDAMIAYEGGESAGVIVRAASADLVEASLEELQLIGHVRIEGDGAETGPWMLQADNAQLSADGSVLAKGGFQWEGSDGQLASGEVLRADTVSISMEGAPAKLTFAGFEWEAKHLSFDRERLLLEAGKGRVRSTGEGRIELSYEAIKPVEGEDATVLALHHPRFVRDETEARAEWALLWINQGKGGAKRAGGGPAPSLFGQVAGEGFSSALDEVYIEGHVEVFQAGERRAEVEAVYLDLVDGRGWLRNARITVSAEVGGELTELAVDAEWLRHSADGSLAANSARITTCDHIDPHYFIQTKDLQLKPSKEEGVRWDISARSNALVFAGGLEIPLPPIEYEADEAGTPLIDRLVLGDTARFGTFLQARVDSEFGGFEAVASGLTGVEEKDITAGASYRASWLGKRGLMLGVGAKVSAEDKFWFNLFADGLYDKSEDRGVLRVAGADREELRGWVRARGRAIFDEREWLDFAFSQQGDAGVQAEFFEREFLSYEERETYLHWRRGRDGDFASARLKLRAGKFRNEVEELPSLSYSRGRAPLFDLKEQPVLYSSSVDVGRYVRREAQGDTISPFDPTFDTLLGTRRVSRFDTRHRLELPTRFAGAAALATPFLEFAGTAWSEGVDRSGSLHRGALSAGLELSTTLWSRAEGGAMHTVAPFLSVSGDLWSGASEGDPVPLDAIEDPLPGDHIDVGVHSRWSEPNTGEAVDVSVFGRYASETSSVLPLEVLGEYLGEVGGRPLALQHDGRYDLESNETLYSRIAAGLEIRDGLAIETGFHHGKDALGEDLFEAASLAARWRISPKWELEARQTVSLLDSEGLSERLVLRRYGHDFVLDMEFSNRSGEGGSSFSFSLSPVVGWASDRLGILDHWLTSRR